MNHHARQVGVGPPSARALDDAVAAAREAYVRRHPHSLARHVVALAADPVPRPEGAPPLGALPFRLVIAAPAGGRIVTVDGHVLIDCRGGGQLAAFGDDLPPAHRLRLLFYLDLLRAGLLVGEDAGLAVPGDAADAACLRAAVVDFLRHRGALF